MADAVIQLPVDSTGKMLDAESLTVGANTVYRQRFEVGGAAAAAIASVADADPAGTEYGLFTRPVVPSTGLAIKGALPPAIVGSFTSASTAGSTIGGDVSTAGNAFVAVAGTYGANMVVVFEASVDSSNPASGNWFAYPGQRVGSAVNESQTPAALIGANAIMAWEFPAGAIIGFRIRLITAPASGTATFTVKLGTIPYDPSPIVQVAPLIGRTGVFIYLDRLAGITTEALVTMNIVKGAATATTGTSYTVTSGKTLHLASLFFSVRSSSAAIASGRVRVRQAAAVLVSSPIIALAEIMYPLGTATAEAGSQMSIPLDIDVPGGQQIGLSDICNATTTTISVGLLGYEV